MSDQSKGYGGFGYFDRLGLSLAYVLFDAYKDNPEAAERAVDDLIHTVTVYPSTYLDDVEEGSE